MERQRHITADQAVKLTCFDVERMSARDMTQRRLDDGRKIVQIQVEKMTDGNGWMSFWLFAVCDDGTLCGATVEHRQG